MSHIALDSVSISTPSKHKCLQVYCSGTACESIVIKEGGVVGDKHYLKDLDRAVMIASTLAYKKAADKDIYLQEGALEENILVDFDPYSLPLGTKIHIGEATLELAQYGTICKSLTRIDSKLPKLLKGERGIFAKVLKPGIVNAGDEVSIETTNLTKG